MSKKAFGIDIGGSGIKGAPVHLGKGELAADRVRIPTPQPSTPEAVADTVAELIGSFDVAEDMPVGVTFPAVIQEGVAKTAANVDRSWIGTDVDAMFTERTGPDVFVVNDADAAGIAEMRYGAGRDRRRQGEETSDGQAGRPIPPRAAGRRRRKRNPHSALPWL